MDFGFRVCGFRIPHPWIPVSMASISSIPDSTDQNYLDSGDRITLHGATKSEFGGGTAAGNRAYTNTAVK